MSEDENAAHRQARVVDPEDFNRTQRFKEIHDARQRVTNFVTQMDLNTNKTSINTTVSQRLGHLIALYVIELEPLIEQGSIDDGDLVPDSHPFDSLRQFAVHMGVSPPGNDGDFLGAHTLMAIFTAANRFYAQVGLDLELEEDDGDAGFDYSDILEEGPPSSGTTPPQVETDGGTE